MTRRLVYQVCIGEVRPLWRACVESMSVYCRRHGFDHHVETQMTLKVVPKASQRSAAAVALGGLPNLEKLAGLSRLVDDYDQVALIDSDVYAAPNAPSIFADVDPTCDVAGVTERSLPICPAYARKLDGYERAQFGPVNGVGLPFLQCGVLVYNRSFLRFLPDGPKAFWEQDCLAGFINGVGAWRWQSEQVTLNWFLRAYHARIQLLDPRWNWLFGMLQPGREREGWFHHFLLSAHIQGDDPETLLRTGKGRARI